MNALDALRASDPAGHLRDRQLDSRDELLLQQILSAPVERPGRQRITADPSRSAAGRRLDLRPAFVTASVAVLLAAVTGVVLQFTTHSNHDEGGAPTSSSTTRSDLDSALFALLPADARTAPALTWTDASKSSTGGPFDTTGRSLYLTAACEGGGLITIAVSGQADIHLDCDHLSIIGPTPVRAAAGADAVSIDVSTLSGHPRYVVKSLALTSAIPVAVPAHFNTEIAREVYTGRAYKSDTGTVPKGTKSLYLHLACAGPSGSKIHWKIVTGSRTVYSSGYNTCDGTEQTTSDGGDSFASAVPVHLELNADSGVVNAWAAITRTTD